LVSLRLKLVILPVLNRFPKSEKFILRIVLEEKLNIPKDSYIKTKSSNPLVATSDLELIFGNADEYLHPGDTILTRTSRNFSDILEPLEQKLNTVMNGIDSLVISINSVLTPESEANLRNSLANLDKSLLALRSSLGPDGSLYNSLANLEAVTSNLNKKNPQIASGIEHRQIVSSRSTVLT
jgi:phospholipid/cholesterol/gamma-HCH transport system substrate-binding protein